MRGLAARTVLVVDDDEHFREQLVELLADLRPDAEVEAVADGHAAVARALELRPAQVLVDYAMPGPSGLNVAAALSQALPGTRIVVVSGVDDLDPAALPGDVALVRKDAHLREALDAALG